VTTNWQPHKYFMQQCNRMPLTVGVGLTIRALKSKQEVLGRTDRLLSFDMTRIAYKTKLPTIHRCWGNVFTKLQPSNDRGIHRPTYSPLIRSGPHRKIRVQQFFYGCVYVAAGTCLPSRCLALKGGIHLTVSLPNDRRDTHADTQTDGRDL
jgi:hypothetical protein